MSFRAEAIGTRSTAALASVATAVCSVALFFLLQGYPQILRGRFTALPFKIVTTRLPDSPLKCDYRAVLAALGGVPPYSWSIAAGNLPPGLTLNASNGE